MSKSTYLLDPEASYLIAGGLGGIGRSMARWLVDRGARHLILVSRSGPKSATAQKLLLELEEKGVHVQTPRCDISDEQALRCALATCEVRMPPVKGCIQSCMVITVRQPRKINYRTGY
jgi:NAD(P)-dependent dehydrogenase (short-subunit alcohol dehydrogenase family)